MKDRIRFVQRLLNLMGFDAGPEDGILGPQTLAAMNQIEGIPQNWSKHRKIVWFIRHLCDPEELEWDTNGRPPPRESIRKDQH